MKYHFRIHKEKPKGYWAECLELEGCVTSAATLKELYVAMEEALNTYLNEPQDGGYLAPLPKSYRTLGKGTVEVEVDPQIAFALLMRHERRRENLTQIQMAKRLKKKDVWSYQRLERRSNPTLATVAMIKEAFPKFPSHLIFG